VTQKQLRDHLDAHGTGLWTDCTDSTPHGSVIGNALEHGVGYTPYCEHFATLCGIEVVLADGTLVRSGGGPAHSTTWNVHRWGTGPSVDGLFGQSNLGIVTRAGVWLMPAPEACELFLIELRDESDLGEVVDIFRDLTLRRVLSSNLHIVNDVLFSAILGQYPRDLLGPGETRMSDEALAALRSRLRLAPMSVTTGLYGTRAGVKEQARILERRLKRFGRISVVGHGLAGRLPGLSAFWERRKAGGVVDRLLGKLSGATPAKLKATMSAFALLQGIPGELVLGFAYFKAPEPRPEKDLDPARDGAGMIWFPVVLPLTGEHVDRVLAICRPAFHRHGFDYANAFISLSGRCTMSLMPIFYAKADPDETARAQALQRELFELTQAAGYPQYRTGHAFHREMFADAPGYKDMTQAIKRALDPNGILAPGRYGMDGVE
jgi:4-cresol dehydrogenase (hydroxylating)